MDALNVADRLRSFADVMPHVEAVVAPRHRDRSGHYQYATRSFAELNAHADCIARGLIALGVRPTTRLVLLVPPGIDFVTLVFGLLRSGAVTVLMDPGMGLRRMLRCIDEIQPAGFVAVPRAHAVRRLFRSRFQTARINVCVGQSWLAGAASLDEVLRAGRAGAGGLPVTRADDPAAVIFTSGSTGPAKGVLYRHGNFDAQVCQIRDRFAIKPGGVDLAGFPLFGLFDAAMGITSVVPDMDASHPARVVPSRIVRIVNDWHVDQAFASPAVWDRVGSYCARHGIRMESLRTVFSSGAPVPAHVLQRTLACIRRDGKMHTPYGATEALPVASICARDVLEETAEQTSSGAGVCVGSKFAGLQWRVVRPVRNALPTLAETETLAAHQVGELIVHGPQVTDRYVTGAQSNSLGKITEGDATWHRMGDLGYLDDRERFWFCGRLAHRVETTRGAMDTLRCEAIFNQHPAVRRSALVGIGPHGSQVPVIVVEPAPGHWPRGGPAKKQWQVELRAIARGNRLTEDINHFYVHRRLPVDVRHNAKIAREELARWAARKMAKQS